VYSIEDAIEIAKKRDKDVVFMAVGFETTAPSTAVTLLSDPPDNFYILSCHRLIPPAVKAILEMGEIRLDGFIEPGHVSTIIGVEPFIEISERYKIPQVIAGFEPLDVLTAVIMLIEQIENGESKVENEYARSVKFEGNIRAKKIMQEVFDVVDMKWRGFPVIEKSGLELRKKFENRNARKVFEDILSGIEEGEEPKGCRCSEILRGVAKPRDCRLFGKICTPSHPVGPCMVSKEGSCYIEFRYSR
ncbi:MAG TPA: hydrogenase formation protein HypD, partial [Thermoplasmatales archaeon]|nr:hydrogenase formation protein HypD [Thermoplasmatales archaeon]